MKNKGEENVMEPWMQEAVRGFYEISKAWEMGSMRRISLLLELNRQTLSKLDYRNPKPTLTWDSCLMIFAVLHRYAEWNFTEEELEEEHRLVDRWISRIVRAKYLPD